MATDRLWRDKEGLAVIIDSSAIIMLFEFSINLENELNRLLGKYKIVVPKSIAEELKLLSEKGRGKKRIFAKASLKLIERYEIVDTEEKRGDESILLLAKKLNGFVLTNDRELRKKLKEEGVHTIFLREKSKLVLD